MNDQSNERDTSYFINQERMEEMYRLFQQDRLITNASGGLLPERSNLFVGICDILDIACGTGGWLLGLAHQPELQLIGIDKSERMIQFAQAQAYSAGRNNVRFLRGDVTKPIDLPDSSIDLVNARMIHGFMTKAAWPHLLSECMRILRPGGTIRLTQDEAPMTNSPAFEQFIEWGTRAVNLSGQSFSPGGSRTGVTGVAHALFHLLRDAHFQNIQHRAFAINFSSGTSDYEGVTRDLGAAFDLLHDYLIEKGVTTHEEFVPTYQRMTEEMSLSDFTGLWYFLTIWGKKPQ